MRPKSSFTSDLEKEQRLAVLLDAYYLKNLKQYTFKRVSDKKSQLAGIDLIFTHKDTGHDYYIDEKAQLDYVNEDLPTFAFELCYQKNNTTKEGWFYDANKKTDFYALVTGIYSDEPKRYTSCKITLVNRKKLISFLQKKRIDKNTLDNYVQNHRLDQGKVEVKELNPKSEGYLYNSSIKKAEKPVNLILKLDFLIANTIAKRLA